MKNNALANKLKELRISHSYKQVDIAAFLGVVRQTYANYENGLRTPDTETLHKIAALYGITLDDLMQLTTTLDPELYYNAPQPSQNSVDIAGFLDYFNNPDILEKIDGDNQTVGLLLCKTADSYVVETSLKGMNNPIGVSKYKILEDLPAYLIDKMKTIE